MNKEATMKKSVGFAFLFAAWLVLPLTAPLAYDGGAVTDGSAAAIDARDLRLPVTDTGH